ncbi:putative E3 ubiquitin-protein ligase LIN [Panicum miliaceum]|uniref:E3 ubiquitin-protein ligase LIN n=1 Tax=Panicum miliaceum TaxID=4540 RepID=A0A3L6SNJ1_PANMI|nr:putative E3 ubiquitin-protein ligase LIN [Panicum miliaceum]
MAGPAPTYSAIIARTAAFLAELVADPLLRRHLLSAAAASDGAGGLQHPATTLQALSLVSDALDTAASASPSPSSLRAAERLLQSLPAATPLSCLLLALACAARRRGGAPAAAAVLDLFALDPALARHELAPAAFEALFAPRLLPAQEMRALEREYEMVLDANCRAYALYLRKILEAGEASTVSSPPHPPELVFGVVADEDDRGDDEDTPENDESASSQNGFRYNPMWAETEEQGDLYPRRQGSVKGRRDLMRPPSLYPQRVPPHLIVQQSPPVGRGSPLSRLRAEHSQSPAAASDDSMEESSSDLGAGKEEKRPASPPSSKPRPAPPRPHADDALLSPDPASSPARGDADPPPETETPLPTPKDFVCPITSQLFDDPVTLETGQTYERRAIQEWLDRGNATCPITRQLLHGAQLPKTNYVLKRLIAAWRDQSHPSPAATPTPPAAGTMDSPAPPFKTSSPSPDTSASHASAPSPTSVIAQATLETAVGELRAAVSCLCTSEELAESEKSVLKIERLWREAGAEQAVLAAIARPAVINGFVEILFNSVSAQVLQVAVFLLAELASRDDAVVQTLTRVDSDVDCLVALFKKGLVEAVVLICLLSPTPEQLIEMDMAEALVSTIRRGDEDPLKIV